MDSDPLVSSNLGEEVELALASASILGLCSNHIFMVRIGLLLLADHHKSGTHVLKCLARSPRHQDVVVESCPLIHLRRGWLRRSPRVRHVNEGRCFFCCFS
jgi:hypothetical protein